MIYGTPQLSIEDDQTDRIGIRTLVLSLFWQPSRWPMTLLELDAEKPPIPDVPGGMLFIADQTRRDGGGRRTYWTFEGVNGDGKSVTFKTRQTSLDYRFEPGFSQVDIALIPNLEELLNKFGGSVINGEIIFPPTISGSTGGVGLAGSGKSSDKPNPMFGYKDFLRMEGTYTFRYASLTQAQSSSVGKIASALPGQPPVFSGRNWLMAPIHSQRRGVIFDISESYWLSGENGWPEAIYGKSGNSPTGLDGLSTGSNVPSPFST